MTVGALFAGGYGKRMQSVSKDVPKTLLSLRGNYVILDRQLREFKSSGVEEVYILSGYRGELLEERYGPSWEGVKITYLKEEKPMGTLWALRNLYNHVNADVILRNGDTLCDLDLRRFISYSLENTGLMSMVVAKMISPFGIVSIRNGYVTGFLEKPVLNHYVNIGCYYLRPGIKDYLNREYEEKDIERTLFQTLLKENRIRALKFNGYWKGVDSVKDYEEVRKVYEYRKDYDFGHVDLNGNIQECCAFENRTIVVSGRGQLKVSKGKIAISGRTLVKDDEGEIEGRSEVRALKESRFSLAGGLTIENSSWS
ncbi:MAG: nucleotidyltransferase family protein [Candidatus Thermoplasmatota archaeon]|nr:nucleotidyltransferase family protein [Candidatus Thermoplasmatota archaeon]MCL5789545.1 nucleotidyltransferase family protein [Candidatus Thermoplasmatota archaeon]